MGKYKSKIYTAAVVMATLAAVCGGWFVTREMLAWREEEFLSGAGAIALRSSQTALLAQAEEDAEADAFQGEELPEDKIRDVLLLWASGGKEMPHEPKEGQMNMEQAIYAGRQWIASLVARGVLPEHLLDGDFDKITAQLSTMEAPTDLDEPLVSYWRMEYIKYDVEISMTIHALSGEVWEASIFMPAADSRALMYSAGELLDMMFPRAKKIQMESVEYDGLYAEKLLGECVFARFQILVIGNALGLEFWLDQPV